MENTRFDLSALIDHIFQNLESKVQYSLVQFWSVTNARSRYSLAASGQPFYQTEDNKRLSKYRADCERNPFFVDQEGDTCWLPGRVAQTGLPQCKTNVQTSNQYPQLNNVALVGCWALPVFQAFGQPNCVIGVIELITTDAKESYADNFMIFHDENFMIFNSLRRELEAVKLKSSTVTTKVEFGRDTIKFELSLWSDMKELEEEVSKRFKKLKKGNFKIKYRDIVGELVLIACDEDVQECITNWSKEGNINTPIRMII